MRNVRQQWLASIVVITMLMQTAWMFAGLQMTEAASYDARNMAKNVVISQFYGGKLNDVEDTYSNDFVELHNPTGEPVSLTGWSLQYADSGKNNWAKASMGTVNKTIPAYGYYLVKLGSNGAVGAALPPADQESASIKLSNKSGKIVLLRTESSLTSMNPSTDVLSTDIVDFVGYGADSYWESPAPESGKQSTLQRLVFDPLNPDQPVAATLFPNRGNNWDSHDNGKDFEKVKGAPVRNSSTTSAYVILEKDQFVRMQSESTVSDQDNLVTLIAVGGLLKQGAWSANEFTVTGLPEGIEVQGAAAGDQIQLTFTSDGTGHVLADVEFAVEIHPEAWDQPNKPSVSSTAYQGNYRMMLVRFTSDRQIVASPDSDSTSIRMETRSDLNATVRLNLSQGLPKDGVLVPEAYTLTGLPAGDWNVQAVGDSTSGAITLTITGQSSKPVMEEVMLHIVLHPEAVQASNDWMASESMELLLNRYIEPVLSDSARKYAVEQRIIADNTFFNDPVTKEYKYGTEGLSANEYTFLRGTNAQFKADLASGLIASPDDVIEGWAQKDILTYTEGDAHIQNVGTFNDNTKQMVFGLNDFDSAGIGSFYEELLRFVTSVYIVPYDKDSSGIRQLQMSDYREVSRVFLETYKDTLVSIHNNKSLKNTKLTSANVTDYTKAVMSSVSKKTYEEALEKLLGKRALNGKLNIAGNPDKFEQATEAEVAAIQAGWETYKTEIRSNFASLTDEQFNDYFTIKDTVRRIHQGVGSIGVKRYNVLIEGTGTSNTDDILLDVKEQMSDASASKQAYLNMGVDVDDYLGTLMADQRSYLIREVSPFKGDYTDKPFQSKDELQQYVMDAAKSYAYASSRLTMVSDSLQYAYEDRFVTEIVPVWNDLVPVILNAAEDYSQQIVADFNLVKDDMRAGRLVDVHTLQDLTVTTGTLEPAFRPEVTSYRMTVSAETENMVVTAKTTDDKATVTLQGNPYVNSERQTIAIKPGQNHITLIITARNGATRAYDITVTRGSITPPTPSNPPGSSNEAGTPVTEPNNGTQSQTGSNQVIQAKGGTFKLEQITLQVPENAVQAGTAIQLTRIQDTSAWLQGTPLQLLGTLYQATRTTFIKPVQITLSYDPAQVSKDENVGLYRFNEQSRAWERFENVQIDPSKGTISGSTLHLGVFAILSSREDRAPQPAPVSAFKDIEAHWGAADIIQLTSLGVIKGYPDQSFQPDRSVTRAELISMIVQSLQLNALSGSGFSDTETHWAHQAIATAQALGIANGYADHRFGPNEWVTREEMAVFVVRAAQLENKADSIRFTDDASVSDWARSAITIAQSKGIVNGYTDGSLKPQGKTTRAEAAVIMMRLINQSK